MGLDVYAYIMVGVPAINYIHFEEKERGIQVQIKGVPAYDSEGLPIVDKYTTEQPVFLGEEYSDLYAIEEVLGDKGLELIRTYDEDINDGDTIGITICGLSQEGQLRNHPTFTTLTDLAKRIPECEEKLRKIGIYEIPTIRLSMIWSN